MLPRECSPNPPLGQFLLVLLGLGALGLLVWTALEPAHRRVGPVPLRSADPPGGPALAVEPASSRQSREPNGLQLPASGPVKARQARTERGFLADFRVLERDRPGALAARAPDVLGGTGPPAEKVALLRALEEARPAEAVLWLEHAVRTPSDAATPQAESLPSFALGELARLAADDAAPRAALERLAFDERSPPLHLRRRAAAAFAGVCPESELGLLGVRLAREPDELLVAGVLSALEPRAEVAGARRLLVAFGAGDALPRTKGPED